MPGQTGCEKEHMQIIQQKSNGWAMPLIALCRDPPPCLAHLFGIDRVDDSIEALCRSLSVTVQYDLSAQGKAAYFRKDIGIE